MIKNKRDNTDLLYFVDGVVKIIFVITTLLTILALLARYSNSFCFNHTYVDALIKQLNAFSIMDGVSIILASLTLMGTIYEYQAHRKRVKAEVLGQYNERYSRDEHVNNVVDYIIRYMDGKAIFRLPTTHDAEMFMRFFEEMQIQIEEDRLVEEQVYELFAYYAIAFDVNDNIRRNLGINDYEKDNWTWNSFKKFTSRMFVRYFIDATEWKLLYDNGLNKSLFFKTNNTKCEITNKDNKMSPYEYKYRSGVITINNIRYQYIMTGSNKPDELHQIGTNVVYVKCK